MVPMGNQQDNLRNLQGSRIADAPEITFKSHMYLTLNPIFFLLHHIIEVPSDKKVLREKSERI